MAVDRERTDELALTVATDHVTQTTSENKVDILPWMIDGIFSDDFQLQLAATVEFRKLLTVEREPPFERDPLIDRMIGLHIVPLFVEFLSRDQCPQLQLEACWCLTNIASGTAEYSKVIVERGAIPRLVDLLESPSDDIFEQGAWALGNIVCNALSYRDMVLNEKALIPMLPRLIHQERLSMVRTTTRTLSILCRGTPKPAFEQVKLALPTLVFLVQCKDEEVITNALWALSYISDGTKEQIDSVIESGICPYIVPLLIHPSTSVVLPALRTFGNVVRGSDSQTQVIIDLCEPHYLVRLFTLNDKKSIIKEACWVISNIMAGNTEQIQFIIDAGIITPLIGMLNTAELDIKKESVRAISNAVCGGTEEQIRFLADHHCIEPLCDILCSDPRTATDPRTVTDCMDALEKILKVGESMENVADNVNPYAGIIDKVGGFDEIYKLQWHYSEEIYEKAVRIIRKYCHYVTTATSSTENAFQKSRIFFGDKLPAVGGSTEG